MVVDGEGNKWAGTYEDGFYRMDAGTNQINWNIPSDKQATVMQRGWINDIYCDKTGNAYIATKGDGLIIYTASTKTFRTIKNNKWTEDNNLKKIVEDAKGNLWMATGKGLSCWDLKNNTFSNYPEGMQLASMDNVTGCTSPDGTVYFAGADEILYFNPDNLAEISPYVHPEVTSVKVMNKEYLSDITQPLFLSYRDNFISFAFSAFDFINEKGDQFAYCLEGFDNDWNYCGNRHFAEYTNLPGGNYTLKLKVQNANGEWIETIHPVILHITTPYWKTWWFFMLCGVAAFALGYQFYYLKMQRKLEAERLRTRLARDLHDDIGSSLSSISMISKMALKNTPDSKEETQFIFNKISESSHKTMESMNDIVWIVNPENDLMDSLLIRMRMYFSELLESKGVKYNFIAAEEVGKVKLDMDQRKNFYLIFKEALNNLTKYSGCTEVMVKILIEGDKILMEIKDNGLGFYPDDVSAKGNGLKNMKERAKMLKGMLTIESKLGQGTTIKLVLPIT
jgi:two-component sensor histidine kinase